MTAATSPKQNAEFWTALAGGVLLTLIGCYGLLTQSGASPRYGAALVALGLAGVARAVASSVESRALAQAPRYLTGAAFGLLVAGFVD